jgi:Spy/CpxP family protein refolding chaperone
MMERSKWYALLFLLGAFVAGAAVGVAGDRALEHRGPPRRGGLDRMAQELGLTAPQRAAFDSILENRRKQMRQLFAPIRPQLDSLTALSDKMRDSTHEQLKRVLTPEQQVKFDKMHEEAKKRAAEARRRFDMNGGPASRESGPAKR